jgi:glycerol uptake facilitator-like aquaporin
LHQQLCRFPVFAVSHIVQLLLNSDFTTGALFPALLCALINFVSLSLLLLATRPISGGHINPLITFGAFFNQLTTFPRTVVYIVFQITGATIAGFLMRAALGRPNGRDVIVPGCWIDPSIVTAGEAVILEITSCLALIFVVWGAGFEPSRGAVYGPILGPLLMGLALGLSTFVTGALKPGYTGASLHPARCFGLMAAEGRWDLHWVHWVCAIIAGGLNALLHRVVIPRKARKI